MTSSELVRSAALGLALLFASDRAHAQEVDDDVRRVAAEQYNRATATEREGFEDRELGGPGTPFLRRCQQDCLISALASYRTMPSRLAAWRVASCAAGTDAWLLVHLAAEAFRTLEPAGIEEWTHASIDDAERARVRAAVMEARRRVGAVRLSAPPGAQVFWGQPGAPLDLAVGQLPAYDADLQRGPLRAGPVRVGDLLFFPAGARFAAVVGAADGMQQIDLVVAPLDSEGPMTALDASPTPSAAGAPVRGTEDVARAFEELRPQFARCRVAGTATITLDIRSDGTVAGLAIDRELGASRRCVEDVIRTARFPMPGGRGGRIAVPIDFGPARALCRPDRAACGAGTECCGGVCRSSRCWSCTRSGQRCSRTDDRCCPGTVCSATGVCR